MVDCLDEIIKEAKCCSSKIASDLSIDLSFGNDDDNKLKLMALNSFIRTLERNTVKYKTVKKTILEYPKKVSLESLQVNKKTLFLKPKPEEKIICLKVEIPTCLSDSEIKDIVEKIKLLCSNCNCNCN
jgi:hypothetical protein